MSIGPNDYNYLNSDDDYQVTEDVDTVYLSYLLRQKKSEGQDSIESIPKGQQKPENIHSNSPVLDPDPPSAADLSKLDVGALNATLSPEAEKQLDQYNTEMSKLLDALTGLDPKPSKEDIAKAKFAYFHPDIDPSGDGAKLLARLVKEKGFDLPANPDTEIFDQKVANEEQIKFQDQFAKAPLKDLTDTEQDQLQYAHLYGPESLSPKLKQIFDQVNSLPGEAVRKEMGLPPDDKWELPKPETNYFDDVISGAIAVNSRKLAEEYVKKAHPEMSSTQQEDLTNQLLNLLKTPNEDDPLNEEALTIKNQVIQNVGKEFAMPAQWMTTVKGASEAFMNIKPANPQIQIGLNALGYAQDGIDSLKKNVSQSADPLDSMSTLDALKVISKALSRAKEMLYTMESQNADQQKTIQLAQSEYNQAKIAINMKQIEEYRQQQAEMEQKQKKAGLLGDIMKIVGPIIVALSAIAAICTGGAAAPFLVLAIAFMAADSMVSDMHLVQKMFQAIDKACGGIPGLGVVLKVLIIALVAQAGPAGVLLAVYAFSQSGLPEQMAHVIVKDILKMDSEFTEMIFAVVINVVAALVSARAGGVAKSVEQLEEESVQIANQMTEVAGKAGKMSMDYIVLVIKKLINALQKAIAGVSEAATDTSAYKALAKAAESASEAVKSLKLVKALSNMLEALTSVFKNKAAFQMFCKALMSTMQLGNAGINVAKEKYNVDIANIQAEMTTTKADADAMMKQYDVFIDVMKDIIKQLQKLINQIIQPDIANISDSQTNMYRDFNITPA